MPRQVREDVGATGAEHRPDEVARTRREAGEAARARASEQPEQDGLGAVVGVMGRRDRVGRDVRCGATKRGRAGVSRSRLEISALGHVHLRHRERDLEIASERRGQRELVASLASQPVVHPVRDEGEAELRS